MILKFLQCSNCFKVPPKNGIQKLETLEHVTYDNDKVTVTRTEKLISYYSVVDSD